MDEAPRPLPNRLRELVERKWTYARTMPHWPHEYIVRERVDETLSVDLVRHIGGNARPGRFYSNTYIYFEEDGLLYWTEGAPLDETTIVNRCKMEDSHESRLRNGTLPD